MLSRHHRLQHLASAPGPALPLNSIPSRAKLPPKGFRRQRAPLTFSPFDIPNLDDNMLVSLTVGKIDAGVAVLLTEDKRLVGPSEFYYAMRTPP